MGLIFETGPRGWPDLYRRPRIFDWTRSHRHARTWILEAGPGSAKTCTALLIAKALGLEIAWPRLSSFSEAMRDLSDAAIAQALVEGAQGKLLLLDGADELMADSRKLTFFERWLTDPPVPTLVAVRRPLSFTLSRSVAAGIVARLDRQGLWFTAQEQAEIAPELPAHELASLSGWPLGLYALKSLGSASQRASTACRLVREELVAPLPAELLEAAEVLANLPRLRPAVVGRILKGPHADRLLHELDAWGLLSEDDSEGLYRWQPTFRAELMRRPRAAQADLGQLADQLGPDALEEAAIFRIASGNRSAAYDLLHEMAAKLPLTEFSEALKTLLPEIPAGDAGGNPDLDLFHGWLLMTRGLTADAEVHFLSALAGFEDRGLPQRAFIAENGLLRVALQRRDLAECARRVDHLEAKIGSASTADRIAYLLNKGQALVDQGREEQALEVYEQILQHPHLGNRLIARIQQSALFNISLLESTRGHLESARLWCKRALRLAGEFGGLAGLIEAAQYHAAILALHLGIQEEGPGPRALDGAQGDPIAALMAARYHLLTGDPSAAKAAARRALDALEARGDGPTTHICMALSLVGIAERMGGHPEAALKFHEQALRACNGSLRSEAACLASWGLSLIVAGQPRAAHEHLARGLELARRLEDPVLRTNLSFGLAVTLDQLGEPAAEILAQAVDALNSGPGYFPLFEDPQVAPEIWRLLRKSGYSDLLARAAAAHPDRIAALSDGQARQMLSLPVDDRTLRISCLGPFEVRLPDGGPALWPRKRARALLAHLILAPFGLHRNDLIDLIFGSSDAVTSGALFDKLASSLRQALEPDLKPRQRSRYLEVSDGVYRFVPNSDAWIDLRRFEAACEEGNRARKVGASDVAFEALRQAAGLYRGELMADLDMPIALEPERLRLRQGALDACRYLAGETALRGDLQLSRSYWERALSIDPADEASHRGLMQHHSSTGRPDLLRLQYEICREELMALGGLEPDPATTALLHQLSRT